MPGRVRGELERTFGTATRWEHWLGRALLAFVVASIAAFFFVRIRIGGVFDSSGLVWVAPAAIKLVGGAGVELFPPEVLARQSKGRAPLIVAPGEGKAAGFFFLTLGLIHGLAHLWLG